MGFIQVIPSRGVCLVYKMSFIHVVLMDCGVGTNDEPLSGQGILIDWALDLILKEVDREDNTLAKPESSFHCPNSWSWDSLKRFSLHSQHNIATQKSPIIWSVLTTIAVNKDRRGVNWTERGGDGRDPWQVG